jgi:threonine/homoserine/homoserine lactone efflux protein
MAGIGVSLSNPYFTGWWATVGTGHLAALDLRTARDYLSFFAGHELGDLAWYLLVAAVLAGGRPWLTAALYRHLLYGCAAAVLGLAAVFLVLALRGLRRHRR